jgi:Tfp pilus assembly protein PilN
MSELRRWLAIGAGIGIEIQGDDLHVSLVRVRPGGIRVLDFVAIHNFRHRPAAEWGAEYAAFLRKNSSGHLSAFVLLPRHELTVRHLALPGVRDKDIEAAVRFQADTLHPYPEDDAVYGWARLRGTPVVLVAVARSHVIDRYATLFSEAGIRTASFTFTAAVVYASMRMLSTPPVGCFLALHPSGQGWEAYGEGPARPAFSATFEDADERVLQFARAELRLDQEAEPLRLVDVLPVPVSTPEGYDLHAMALSYATALNAACSWLALPANLLPQAQRISSSRAVYVPTLALAGLLLVALATLAVYGGVVDKRYLETLRAEIALFSPQASKVRELETRISAVRARRQELRDFRLRTRSDLDALAELTRILAPPAWVSSLQLTRSTVMLNGEATRAPELLEELDKNPLFRNSEFTTSLAKVGEGQSFAIRMEREGAILEPRP